jgi:hypothetical protein
LSLLSAGKDPHNFGPDHVGKALFFGVKALPFVSGIHHYIGRNRQNTQIPVDRSPFKRLGDLIDNRNRIEITANTPISPGVEAEIAQFQDLRMALGLGSSPRTDGVIHRLTIRPSEHGRTQGSHRHRLSHLNFAVCHTIGLPASDVDDLISKLHRGDNIQHVRRFARLFAVQQLEVIQARAADQDLAPALLQFLQGG